ncbi:MAG: hypothetical protein K6F92_04305 [Lachnospiraceae bacterium]|nr:hypothetical protein [Lachnospiraceae bacterium]
MSAKNRREREMFKYRLTTGFIVGLTVALVIALIIVNNSYRLKNMFKKDEPETTASGETTQSPEDVEALRVDAVIAQARIIADGYDYEGAIEFIKSDEAYRQTLKMLEEVESLENEAKTMVKWSDVRTISHIYVNSLIANMSRAKTGTYGAANYNSDYITTGEFKALLEELYKRDYVLVSIHDIAYYDEEKNKMVWGEIYLPAGKTPIVLSQENTCYSTEKSANGCADKMVIDAYGDLLCQFNNGTENLMGAYDLVPILEDFIVQHPSFSYRGARALLGISGKNGLFGYNISDKNASDYQINMDMVAKIAAKLTDMGYEFAFNGYDYSKNLCKMDYDTFVYNCAYWKDNIASIIGGTDVVIFPQGGDIGDWRYYSGDYFNYLKGEGYNYYVNSNDADKAWNQILDAYARQGRRIVSGATLYSTYQGGDYLSDLCDAKNVYDYSGRVF